jgi:hypothetical protein
VDNSEPGNESCLAKQEKEKYTCHHETKTEVHSSLFYSSSGANSQGIRIRTEMKTQLLKDWVEALEIASLYLRARQGAERDETKEIKKGKRETYDFEILLINMIFLKYIYFWVRSVRRDGFTFRETFVHVLALLAAGFALCFGESINLT